LKSGVLILGAGLTLIVVSLLVIAWVQVGGEEMTPVLLNRTLSAAPAPDPAGNSMPSGAPPSTVRVLIDVKDADVEISPGQAGSSLQVEASYDPRYFRLEQRSAPEGEEMPTAHVWFRRVRGGGLALHYLRQLVGATRPIIQVSLPPDQPILLHLNTSSGLTQAEIGGLQVEEFYAELSTGGLAVDVSEPSVWMERFEIDSRQATIAVRNLGNASPRRVKIDSTMGGGEIDLRGAWRRDADVLLETEMAGGTLRLPADVDIEGLDDLFMLPGNAEIPRPTLRFAVESTVGRFTIQH
jgi:hypothetical protein